MTKTRPATAQESAQPTSLLPQIGRLFYDIKPVFEHFVGMSQARWSILSQLRCHERLSQSTLQQRIKVDPAAITRQVKQLEEEGLVARCPDPQDNRFTLVSLTETGRLAAEDAYSRRDAFEARLVQHLSSADLATLQHCISTIHQNLKDLAAEQEG
jgi:DNA-binding MarR family transcriptional regulator